MEKSTKIFRAWNTTFKEYYYSDKLGLERFFELYTSWQDFKDAEQYSGLKDPTGTKIYENDVVYIAGYGNYVVEFPFMELYQAYPEGDIGKILGNINQNPEILEDQ